MTIVLVSQAPRESTVRPTVAVTVCECDGNAEAQQDEKSGGKGKGYVRDINEVEKNIRKSEEEKEWYRRRDVTWTMLL